jgi:YVTN family beta-propeller protein
MACALGLCLALANATPALAHDPVAFLVAQPYEDATSIDLATNAVSHTPIGWQIGEFAFSPDGRTAYAATGEGIKAINVETKQLEGETIGHEGWIQHIVVTPDGSMAFADEEKSQRIFAIELGGQREDKQIWLDEVGGVEALAIAPDGSTVFVMDSRLHGVISVDVATHAASAPIVVAAGEETLAAMAMSPDGHTLYVADRSSATIVPVDVATRSAAAPIHLGDWAITAIAVSPDGETAYVTGKAYDAPVQIPGVVPVDLSTGAVGAPIAIGTEPSEEPNSIALTPDGRMAYVTSYETGSVTPINLTTRTAETAIAVGGYPTAIAIDPAPSASASGPAPASSSPVAGATGPAGAVPSVPTIPAIECVVPRLARIALPTIRKRLRRSHCRLGRIRYRHSARRSGELVSQSVRPGRRLAVNARIGVVLSTGPNHQRT